MTLTAIDRYYVPKATIDETDAALRRSGARGLECFVLWSGIIRGTAFEVRTCHVPQQTGYKLANGLCVRVDGPELHRLNRWLFDEGQVLGVQLHSHPMDAFHSDTDDTYPIVTLLGGLSIVVPYFARRGLRGEGVVTYNLQRSGWVELSADAVKNLLEFGA